ncbi:hypothetical protein AJ80_07234 [Polytolypa hystricis UAMH7299]|uniref:Autophagy-related protein n=1 Tax=Polytolypa hystricis (strain UAMH7299) TaxID=1447883 RepID=A0A2B7XQK0_POLH7|nr:hypothetical protein AJ80_07234 [Polytolypa hystricis UAMH7299]
MKLMVEIKQASLRLETETWGFDQTSQRGRRQAAAEDPPGLSLKRAYVRPDDPCLLRLMTEAFAIAKYPASHLVTAVISSPSSSVVQEIGATDSTMADQTPPMYPSDDTRPTSKKELAGWYSYGWAAEVFAVCAMGSFLPMTLEQMARDQGVLLSDRATPCSSSWQSTSDSTRARSDSDGANQCVIYFLGVEINTASFAMYTFSISVLIQSLLIVSMSGAADHGVYRKSFLLTFAFIGSITTMFFLVVGSRLYLLASLLAIVANTCFGASFVLLNSFLPLLVRHHPTIQTADEAELGNHEESLTAPPILQGDEGGHEYGGDMDSMATPLLSQTANYTPSDGESVSHKIGQSGMSPELKLSTTISSNGIGIGYVASVILQVTATLLVLATGSTTFSLRLVLFIIGLWWLVFTIPTALWLRPRPGPPLPDTSSSRWWVTWFQYVAYAWSSLGRTALRARQLKDVVIFLSAWFLLSDAIATVSGTAVLFAKTQLNMNLGALGLINVVVMLAGVCGAFLWSYLSRILNWRVHQTLLACICLFELIPLYGLLGYFPPIKRLGVFGLQQPWEMYPLGAVFGLVMGGLSSYCRSLFGELIPPGFETSFYALYAITDKGSSVFGPAIVGMITDRYGEIRPAFVFLACLILSPLPLMMFVDVDRGRRDARRLAEELSGIDHDNMGESEHS